MLTEKRSKVPIGTPILVLLAFALFRATVFAEVRDKEPSLTENWVWSVVTGLIVMMAWRWRWWAGLTVSAIAVVRLVGVYLELRDPVVGPAIRLEAGERYVTHFYLAVVVAVVLHAAGGYLGIRRSPVARA